MDLQQGPVSLQAMNPAAIPGRCSSRLRLWRAPLFGRPVPRWLGGSALVIAALALVPLGFIVAMSLQIGWQESVRIIMRPRVGELLINTGLLMMLVVPLCVLLGVAMAWLTHRSAVTGRALWSLFAASPLAMPAFIHAYAWSSFWPSMNGLSGAVFLSVIAYYPFVYLPAAAMLRRMDPLLEESAASLRSSPWAVFRRVTWPQLRLAVWGGSLLVAIHLLAEYGLYAMIRFDTFTTAIFDQFQSSFNGPVAIELSGILALACLSLLLLEGYSRGEARYARVGSGAARPMFRVRLGWAGNMVALLLCLAVSAVSLGVPLVVCVNWLRIGGLGVWQNDALWQALLYSLLLVALGAGVIVLAAIPFAWLSVRAPCRPQRLLEGAIYHASALPGIVTALAMVSIFVQVTPLYQSIVVLLLAYLILFLPRAVIILRAGIAQTPVSLENAACSLGRTPTQALWSITLRLATPSLIAAMLMAGVAINNELVSTLLLAPNGVRTLATGFWALGNELDYAAAAPYALLLVMVSLPLTWALYRCSAPQ